MSTATDLLDAILAESEDETVPGQYSIDDALNDQSDFTLDSLEDGKGAVVDASAISSVSEQPHSTHGGPLSGYSNGDSVRNGLDGAETTEKRPFTPTQVTKVRLNFHRKMNFAVLALFQSQSLVLTSNLHCTRSNCRHLTLNNPLIRLATAAEPRFFGRRNFWLDFAFKS